MKNPFGQIVSFEDYVDIIGIPKEQLNSEEVKNRINKWLVQATEQFDSMISGNGQLGRLYRWFEKLENNEEDNYKKYKLIKAICSWVETFVIKGKFWVDGLPVINSNVDIQINSSSNDSNVEAKRKDIIQDLVSVGLYQTTNFGDNNTFQDNQQNAEQLIEDLIVLSTSELQQNYLKLNPQKSLEGNLDFANNDLVNGGNIIGSTQHARNNIQYYNIIDSTIDLNRNTVIGTLPQDPTTAADIAQINQNIANINQEQITQNTNISNNANEINTIKAKDIEQNNRLTQLEQETEDNFNEIANIKTKDQQQDNSIQTNTTNIQTNTTDITALDSRLLSVSGLLNQTIDGLRTLRPFKFVGLYDSSRTYMVNEMVSKDDKFYLSLEDNNTTTPPSDKWLIMKEFQQVDLSDYPTKLEVEAIKNNLQQSITSNTNNITNLNNEVVKIAGNQTITGAKTFDNQVLIRKDGTPLALRAVNPGKIYMIMKGADDNANFSLGANSSNTSLEVNRGDLIIKTQQANKNVTFENVARVKLNYSALEVGTEINAGFGGGEVKFIPEDNSTKTLKFYNNNPNDTRRFKLLVPEPMEAQNPATKNYVDNKVNTNTTNITTIRNNYLDKTATGVQQIAAGSVYFNNQVIINQPYNSSLTPNADFQVSGQGFIENLEADNATFNTSVIVPTPTQNDHAANKQYVDNAIQNIAPGSGGSIDTSNFATLNTNQTISGQKTFTNRIFANGGITNLPNPTNTQEAANKQYVDNQISQIPTYNEYNIITSNNGIFNNLQILTIDISRENSLINKSWMIKFDRMGNNGNKYEGTINYNFLLPEINQATFTGNSFWYNSTNKRFETGANAGITILRTNANTLQLTIQCWDNGNRISKIKLFAPK